MTIWTLAGRALTNSFFFLNDTYGSSFAKLQLNDEGTDMTVLAENVFSAANINNHATGVTSFSLYNGKMYAVFGYQELPADMPGMMILDKSTLAFQKYIAFGWENPLLFNEQVLRVNIPSIGVNGSSMYYSAMTGGYPWRTGSAPGLFERNYIVGHFDMATEEGTQCRVREDDARTAALNSPDNSVLAARFTTTNSAFTLSYSFSMLTQEGNTVTFLSPTE